MWCWQASRCGLTNDLPCSLVQDVDLTVSRKVDEEVYDLGVGQRVFVQVPPAKMMGFDYSDIDATSAGI